MTASRRRAFLLSLCGAALTAGCSFPTCMYLFLPEAKEPAELKRLADPEGKKEVKVVLWSYMTLDPREEFVQADRLLAAKLADRVHRLSEENREKLTVVKPSLVEQYKSRNPDWQSLDLAKVGRYFQADYVVSLEINKFSLYEPKTQDMIFRGRSEIRVTVLDVHHPDEDPQSREFTDIYPGEVGGSLDNFDITPSAFREKFLDHMALRLAFYFVEHPKRARVMVMDN